jgi:hypothetical protein
LPLSMQFCPTLYSDQVKMRFWGQNVPATAEVKIGITLDWN